MTSKVYFIAIVTILAFFSCKKGERLPLENGCIRQIKWQNFNIKAADSVSTIQLFTRNNIPYNDLQLESVLIYTAPDSAVTDTFQSVFAIQKVNGLPVFCGEIWYQFKNGSLQSSSGTVYGPINLDDHPVLSLPQLSSLYLAAVRNNNNALANNLKDSCLVAQFGYYDLDVTVNQTPNFTKAWLVKPSHSGYPAVIFKDGSGATITYNAGVVLFFSQSK